MKPSLQPRSRLAHESTKWADSFGRGEDYNLALFRAFFEHSENIEDVSILMKIATGLGLDALALQDSLLNGDFTSLVLKDENDAKLIGVRAVPAFVMNNKVLAAGVQSAERLLELIYRA